MTRSSLIGREGRPTALERGCSSLVPSRRPLKGLAPSLAILYRRKVHHPRGDGLLTMRRTLAGGFGSRPLSRFPTYACVNGRRDFADRDRAAFVSSALSRHSVPPSVLTIEGRKPWKFLGRPFSEESRKA